MTGKRLEAEVPHDLDLIERHRPLGVVGVVLAVRRLAAVAVAAQIGGDDGVVRRELGRHQTPGDVRLRRAMEQQHRRSRSTDDAVDRRARGLERERFEIREEPVGRRRGTLRLGQYDLADRGARNEAHGLPQELSAIKRHAGLQFGIQRSLLCTVPR
jgi:hypothetical protein